MCVCVHGWRVSVCLSGGDKYSVVSSLHYCVFLCVSYSTFDRLLDAKLREEELTIPVLRPHPEEYK